MQAFLEEGFILKEDIIKLQHNMVGTIPWKMRKGDFYFIAHEHFFVFRKPEKDKKFQNSKKVQNDGRMVRFKELGFKSFEEAKLMNILLTGRK